MTTWQQYWQNEGEQSNQDMLDALRARGGSYDQIKVRRIAAEEKMAANPGTGVGSVYNPVLGRPQVRDALGGTMAAGWNIGGAIADGTPVQLMDRGAGIVADAKQGRGSGDNLSAGTTANRTGSLPSSGGFSPTIPSDANGEDAWIPGPDGSCTLGNYAVGKAPPGSFKTLQECREAQDSDYDCIPGTGCTKVPKGTGKYNSLGECQAALVPAGFTGGQCVGRLYNVNGAYTQGGIPRNLTVSNFVGPITAVNIIRLGGPPGWYGYFTITHSPGTYTHGDFNADAPPTLTIVPANNLPDDCGNPPKRCP